MSKKKPTSAADAARPRNPFAHAAPAYAKRGWAVVPARYRAKSPIVSLYKGTTSQRQIAEWIRKYATANVSIVTGEVSGIIVIDIDPRHGGHKCIRKLEKILGKLPRTVKVRTGGGGWHLYFRWFGKPVKCGADLGKVLLKLKRTGVDVRADGGLAMAPPSVHESGQLYTWELHPKNVPLAKLPGKWRRFLLGTAKATKPAVVQAPSTEAATPVVSHEPPASLTEMRDGCAWLKHCKVDAKTLPEPEWLPMLGLVARTTNGIANAHKWSKPHPEYSKAKTDAKIAHALKAGPRTCANIREQCGGEEYCKVCPHAGKITSPIELGRQSNLPRGYFEKGNELYFMKKEDHIRVSDMVEVLAMTRDYDSSTWGRLLRWTDQDGKEHQMIMPAAAMLDSASVAVKPLVNDGLRVHHAKYLLSFIQGAPTHHRIRLAKRTGWQSDRETYVLPTGNVITAKASKDEIKLDSAGTKPPTVSGSLESWQKEVAALCVGNSRMLFAVSTAFAAYLLNVVGEESGGFHLRGPSSKGKSKLQRTAASVTGLEMETWRTTPNALDALAARHNDCYLWLDELGMTDARTVGEMAYTLTGEKGKNRMSKEVMLRDAHTWRTLFISSGEVSLGQHMATADKVARAGMEARMPDIPAVVENGHGVFENLHGHSNGDAFAKHLDRVAKEHRGTAGPAFLRPLTKHLKSAREFIDARRAYFMQKYVPKGADGQVTRVAGRFALVAAAGELAIRFGVVPWEKGAARQGVARCFGDWLAGRESIEAGEGVKMVAQVRGFLQSHGTSRFTRIVNGLSPEERTPRPNRAGFVRIEKGEAQAYIILSETWKSEVCAGYHPGDVARELVKLGHLKVGKDGKAPTAERLPGMKVTRAYVVNVSVFGEEPVKQKEAKAT